MIRGHHVHLATAAVATVCTAITIAWLTSFGASGATPIAGDCHDAIAPGANTVVDLLAAMRLGIQCALCCGHQIAIVLAVGTMNLHAMTVAASAAAVRSRP
jgi:hypothetical protein